MGGAVNEEFSWPVWFGGFALTIAVGAILNFLAGFAAIGLKNTALGALIGAGPGLILAAVSFRISRRAFALGALCGAFVVAIVGGICGASLSGTRIGG